MNHISIKRLQCILLKTALVLGVEVCPGVEFREVMEPASASDSWRLGVRPETHPLNNRGLDVLIGAEVILFPVHINLFPVIIGEARDGAGVPEEGVQGEARHRHHR